MERIAFSGTVITGGFWKQKQDLVRKTTAKAVYDRFSDTGRFDAFRCDWKEGMPNRPHYFWDSDVAKWIEGIAYLCAKKREPKWEKIVDRIVALICKNQWEDGYFNIYYTLFKREERFTVRGEHELYCAGHLIEAAVAYYNATGKRTFLDAMMKYADYIERRFVKEKNTGFVTPGHEEIELALVKLYECTGERRYLDLAKHFIDLRGTQAENEPDWLKPSYNQSHLPVREQKTAEGHSVRATYLYCAMADIARLTGDEALKQACKDIFDDIVYRKMYISGGIGSSSGGEAFTVAYDLSNLLAYTETCAAIGLALFAGRMQLIDIDSKYADTVERIIYNGFMSSLSLDGKSFFYENPLETMPYLHTRDVSINGSSVHWPQLSRSEVFVCSCCPPNVVRFIPSIADLTYTVDRDPEYGTTLFVHQFMESETTFEAGGKTVTVKQKTRYPENGRVNISVTGASLRVAVRVPGWSRRQFATEKGYAYYYIDDGQSVDVDFGMEVRLVEARREVAFDCGKVAVMRGPVLYCMEDKDDPAPLRDIVLDPKARFRYVRRGVLGVPNLTVKALRRPDESPEAPLYRDYERKLLPFTATLIPYYAFANRGPAGMQVWFGIKYQ